MAAEKPPRFLQQAVAYIGISGIDRRRSAGVEGGLPFRRVDIRYGWADAVEGARQVDGSKPKPARPNDQQRVVCVDRSRLFQCAVRSEARTREGRGKSLRQRVELEEIPRMVDEYVVAETPVAMNTKVLRPRAKVLMTSSAKRALPTAAPSVDDPPVANVDAGCVWTQLVDYTDDLVAENARRLDRLRQVGLPLAAEIKISFG